jgi:hypothetical protein
MTLPPTGQAHYDAGHAAQSPGSGELVRLRRACRACALACGQVNARVLIASVILLIYAVISRPKSGP